jgi:hypothetical protein
MVIGSHGPIRAQANLGIQVKRVDLSRRHIILKAMNPNRITTTKIQIRSPTKPQNNKDLFLLNTEEE